LGFRKNSRRLDSKNNDSIPEEDVSKLEKLIDDLENNEEVQDVYTNAE
jgi:transcriptional/translational regulatory protein YebC/TACO1